MKNLIKSFAALAASLLAFSACQRETAPVEPEQQLYYITFVAEEPATKTTVEQGTDGEGNKVANYSWTASDANSERWTVYRGTDVAESVTATLSEGLMKVSAGFASASKEGDSFVALFNKGVSAVQNIPNDAESVYDPASDVMVSAPIPYEDGVAEYGFRFKRLGAIGKATVKGLTGMTALVDAKLIATDGKIIAADYDVEKKAFAATGSTSITVKGIDCDPDASNNFSFYFITVPSESVNLKLLATVWDGEAEERLFVKQFARPITGFSEGDVFAFNVSGFTEVTTKANFNINGEVTSKPVYEGESVEFPEAPSTIAGYDFVGWSKSSISGTQQEAPELVDPSTEVMGNADVTYYAVYAKTTGHGTATHTITYNTANIPTSYGDAADVVLEGVTFNVTQMYKNGEKMQWKASQGTMYNKDAFASIQSVAITYGADNYKNFTVKVGDSANPTSGTSITAAQVGQTATYIYDCSASASDYFVLANGSNAGYLTSIVITYLGGAPTYEDYCTSIDTRTVTSLAWSAPTATVKLNGDENVFPELSADPEEVLAGVVYSSSETSVADIDESGVITLKATGETTITATFPDGDPDYQPSSASYTLVVTAPAKHTVTFSVNGNTSSEEFDENDLIEFPDVPAITGVVFRGWTKNAIVGTQADAPSMIDTDAEAMGNADVTYYAVFATETEGQEKLLETVGFESSEGYTATSTYNSSNYTTGSTGSKWTINYGAFATNGAIIGSQSAQFRVYNSGGGYGELKNTVAYTEDIVKVAFSAKAANTNGQVKVSYSANGSAWTDITTQSLTTTTTEYSCDITATGARYIKFTAAGTKPSSGNYSIYVDGVKITSKSASTYSDYCTTVVALSSVVVSGTALKVNYKAGESFDVAGLVAKAVYSGGREVTVTDDAQWIVTPAGALAAGTTSVAVTATYKDVTSAAYPVNITVTEIPAVDTMDGIFAAATAAGSTAADIKVKFTNCVITAIKNNNAYLTDNAGKGLVIYTADHGFAVGDKLNGTVNCKVQLYNGASELTALAATTEGLTVTKDGVVTPQSIAIANLSGVNTGAVLTFESLKYNGSAFSDGENTITPYNTFITLPALTSGRNYQVNGVYIQYYSTKEIAPRSEEDFVLIEDPYLTATANKTTGIAAAGETVTVTVATNVSTGWSASSNNAAFVIGNKTANTFDVVVAKNEDTANAKSATITVTATGVDPVNITLTQDKADAPGAKTYNFADMTDFSSWGSSYEKKTTTFSDGAYAELASANKSTTTVTDCPVTKGGDVIFKAPNGKNIKSLTFVCTQWTTKAQTITLNTSSNGTDFTATSTTSSDFTLTASNLSNVRAVKFTFSNANNQVGIKSITVTYEDGGSDPDPVDASWSVSPVSVTVDKDKTATATITTDYDGTLAVRSNAVGIATATISGKVITVTGVSKGSTTLTVTGPATSAFNAVNKTINVTVNEPTGTKVTFVAGTDKSSTTSITKDGITLTATTFSNDSYYQAYSGTPLDVSSTVGTIKSIEITCTASGTSNYGPSKFSVNNNGSYSYSGKVGTWTGSATSVSLATSAQVRMTQVVVTYE